MPTYTNTRVAYIKNGYNQMYCGVIQQYTVGTRKENNYNQVTGWHYIPNQYFYDLMTAKQWHDLATTYERFRPSHLEITVQNLIPLTDDLSIAQDTTFMSFNNTIYALTYQDSAYETSVTDNANPKVYYREGVTLKISSGNAAVDTKAYLPIYTHRLPATNQNSAYLQWAWDPMVNSHDIGELRPGKNAVTFSWSANAADADKWYSTSEFFASGLTYDLTDVQLHDEILSNWINSPITPGTLYKSYPANSWLKTKQIIEYKNLWKYPIPMMFIKMIPIFGSKNQLLQHEGQIIITTKITFEGSGESRANNMMRLNRHWTENAQVVRAPGQENFAFYTSTYGIPERISLPVYQTGLETNDKAIVVPEEERKK